MGDTKADGDNDVPADKSGESTLRGSALDGSEQEKSVAHTAFEKTLNTDSKFYEGTDIGNSGGVRAEPIPWNDRPYSIKLRLPPLAVMYFKPQRN